MKKLTDFAVFSRKLRIDNNQILKEMADSLGVSSSYLSAVENGTRSIPDDWYKKITSIYNLDSSKQEELFNIIKCHDLQFNDIFDDNDLQAKKMLISFARRCQENDITPDKFDKIIKIMEGENKDEG